MQESKKTPKSESRKLHYVSIALSLTIIVLLLINFSMMGG